MTKKDFEAIATVLKNRVDVYNKRNTVKERGTIGKMQLEALVSEVADYLSTTNDRFDRFKFYQATGINDLTYSLPEHDN